MVHGINETIFASKKYITLIITELEFLDFPRIWGQNYNTWRIFEAWNAIMSNFKTSCFYERKLWYDILVKIPTWNSLTFPWHLPLFIISLTLFQIPWQFPDLEEIKFSQTFPWRVATLPVLSRQWGHSDPIVLKPFDLAQVCHENKICPKLALTWKLTLELTFPAHCISN